LLSNESDPETQGRLNSMAEEILVGVRPQTAAIKIPGRILTPLRDTLAEPLKQSRIDLPRPFDGGAIKGPITSP
jgi:hypothetical protein